jgi:hypothetical protein
MFVAKLVFPEDAATGPGELEIGYVQTRPRRSGWGELRGRLP